MVTPAPLCKVDSFMQESLDTYTYYLECGHTKQVTLDEHPDNVWMMRCEACAGNPKQ